MSATQQSIEEGGGGGGTDLFEKIILVDSVYGNDATAIPYDKNKPFQTIGTAQLYAVYGDTIVVNPGNYNTFSQLSKDGVNYYFHPNANVFYYTWLLDDGVTGFPQNTKIFGYGNFTQSFTFAHGAVNIVIPSTEFTFEFNRLDSSAGATFVISTGRILIKGNYINNSLQYVFLGFNDGVWDVDVARIDNINATSAPTFVYALLSGSISGEKLQSNFKCNEVNNNGNGSFGCITTVSCGTNHKIRINANILHRVPSPSFLCSAISLTRGGIVEFTGHINTDVSIGLMYGDFNFLNPSSILFDNCILTQKQGILNRPSFCVNNESHWITIKDSLVVSDTPITCAIGTEVKFADLNYGNMQIINSTLRNIFDDGATPTANILLNKINGIVLLDNVTLEQKSTLPTSYSIATQGLNLPQSVSVLSSIATTKPTEPAIVNNIAGSNIFVTGLTTLTNPLID